jgi:hypothetical protein
LKGSSVEAGRSDEECFERDAGTGDCGARVSRLLGCSCEVFKEKGVLIEDAFFVGVVRGVGRGSGNAFL